MQVAAESLSTAAPVAALNFVPVPETTLPNGTVVPAFRVAQYFASEGLDGKAIISESAVPWVEIDYHDTRKACEHSGFGLLTELQALAIAHDVANVAANWTGGAVGEGSLIQGLRNESVDEAQAGDYVPPDEDERRWFVLSNGSRVCDVAGNLYTWIFDNVQGDEHGIVAKAFAADSPSITTAHYPSMEKGTGWQPRAGSDWSGSALVRGGFWRSGDGAGVFRLGLDWPGDGGDYLGFRCTLPA
jgi:hypothetical protein